MVTQQTGQYYEKLISIEDVSDYSSSSGEENSVLNHALTQSGQQFQADINKLKRNSSVKFRKQWHEIIQRYSLIDDTVESDEIDLHTGKIIVDNGHIRSLADDGQTIDGVRIHRSIWAGDYDYERILKEEDRSQRHERKHKQKMRAKLKSEDRFHNSSPINTSDSEVLEDNLLLINLSPSKRLSISPLKRKASKLPSRFMLPSPVKRSMKIMGSSPEKETSSLLAESLPIKAGCARIEQIELENPDYDELYSVISDLTDNVSIALFSCAFPGCPFSSESKASYRAHLISNHATGLQRIGYPVSSTSRRQEVYHIPELTILKLNLHFPMQMNILPEIPYECKKKLVSGNCKKIFLNSDQLAEHQSKFPQECSIRKQVLLCPILGCDFMTDDGFKEWRTHVNSHESKLERVKFSDPERKGSNAELMDDIEDVFSDTVSSLDFSDDVADVTREQKGSGYVSKKISQKRSEKSNVALENIDEFWNYKSARPKHQALHLEIRTSDEEEE